MFTDFNGTVVNSSYSSCNNDFRELPENLLLAILSAKYKLGLLDSSGIIIYLKLCGKNGSSTQFSGVGEDNKLKDSHLEPRKLNYKFFWSQEPYMLTK